MENKIKSIVVDDEEYARSGLVSMLSEFEDIEVIAACENGLEAITKINELKPDIVFLDIQMPHIDGFEVIELLGNEIPGIIFVTAFDEYAGRAFEANAIDYLLKPVNPKRLEQSILKLRTSMDLNQPAVLQMLENHKDAQKEISRILVRDGQKIHVIAVEEIIYFEAQDDYVAIRTEKEVYLKLERLSKLENQLAKNFGRIHRSYLVNLDYVQYIQDQKLAVLRNGSKLPVSRSGYARFFK
jgi:two-component system, LytTR family, response regulator